MKHLFLLACSLYLFTISNVYAPSKIDNKSQPSSSRHDQENVEQLKRTVPKKKDKILPVSNTAAINKINKAEVASNAKKKVYKTDPNAGSASIKIPSSGAKIKVSRKPKDTSRAAPSNRNAGAKSAVESDQTKHDWNENVYIFDRRRDMIGSGNFGKVYKVIRKSDGAQFALKEVPYSRVKHDKTELRHTKEEIKTLESLPHTVFVGLVAWYAGKKDNAFRFVMEWVSGGDFYTLQRSVNDDDYTFQEHEVCYYGGQVLLGLHYMHTYVHRAYRDLKGENILVDSDGSIKLTDFGLVANLQNDDGTLKRATTLCGTPEFLAPEIILGQAYTTEVDMWSLGVFLYEIRTGFSPFKPTGGEEMPEIFENIVNYKKKNGKFEVHFDPNYFSENFHSLLTHLLDGDPSKRYTANDAYNHRFFQSCHANWPSVNDENVSSYAVMRRLTFLPAKPTHTRERCAFGPRCSGSGAPWKSTFSSFDES